MASGYSSLSLTYQTLLTTTLMKVLDSGIIHDQVFDNDPLLEWLNSNGRVRMVDGGERIRIAIRNGKNSTVNSYSGSTKSAPLRLAA